MDSTLLNRRFLYIDLKKSIYFNIMYNSQAGQDKFALEINNFKKNGYFIELGSSGPIKNNNTYILEKSYKWKGIMIEKNKWHLHEYKQFRSNSIFVINDAVQIDYKNLFIKNDVPKNIDYLQIDLEVSNSSTLDTLLNMEKQILNDYKFATITFEHDYYFSAGEKEDNIWKKTRDKSREIFKNLGYYLLFPDVALDSNEIYRGKKCGSFEDWYVHPDLVDMNHIKLLVDLNENNYKNDLLCKSIFFKNINYSF